MNHHEETIKVIKDLGISGVNCSEAMNISHSLFGNKFNPNQRNKFSEENYKYLVKWLKSYVSKL